jgi:hypothetical protein
MQNLQASLSSIQNSLAQAANLNAPNSTQSIDPNWWSVKR